MMELKKHHVEKAEMAICRLLHDPPWYSDWDGCYLKAQEILSLPEIKAVKAKEAQCKK